MHHTSTHELWDALDHKYAESDAGRELYVNDQYHKYKMVDDSSIMEQAHEIQLLVGNLRTLIVSYLTGSWLVALLPNFLHLGSISPRA
jgi:hypothetical protein